MVVMVKAFARLKLYLPVASLIESISEVQSGLLCNLKSFTQIALQPGWL